MAVRWQRKGENGGDCLHRLLRPPQNTKLGRAAAHARRIAALTQKAAAAELARDEQARLVEAATAASAAVASQVR